ncbi:MAG: glycosyltransferase family 39 protein [Planctomycetes bacterium]|nr:glycosyltransferase family 39 protein [Planctomycetota bacterium]
MFRDKVIICLLLLQLGLSAVRFIRYPYFYDDEAAQALCAELKPLPLIHDQHPMFNQHFYQIWIKIFGISDVSFRIPTFILMFLSFLLFVKILKLLIEDKISRYMCLFAYSIHPLLILWLGSARYYAFILLFFLLIILLFLKLQKSNSIYIYLFLGLSLILGLMMSFIFINVWLFYFILIYLFLTERKKRIGALLTFFISFVICYELIRPIVTSPLESMRIDPDAVQKISIFKILGYGYFVTLFGETIFPWRYAIVIPIAVCVSIPVFYLLFKRLMKPKEQSAKFIIAMLIFTFALLITTASYQYGKPSGKYAILTIATSLITFTMLSWQSKKLRNIIFALLAISFSISNYNLLAGRDFHKLGAVYDWGSLFSELKSQNLSEQDLIIHTSITTVEFYGKKMFPSKLYAINNDFYTPYKRNKSATIQSLSDKFSELKRIFIIELLTSPIYSYMGDAPSEIKEALQQRGFRQTKVTELFEDPDYQERSQFLNQPMNRNRLVITILEKS